SAHCPMPTPDGKLMHCEILGSRPAVDDGFAENIAARSLQFDVRELDHLAPFLSFISDELAELGRRALKRRATHVGKPRFDLGIGEGGIDLLVELVNNLRGHGMARADTIPTASLIAWYEIG